MDRCARCHAPAVEGGLCAACIRLLAAEAIEAYDRLVDGELFEPTTDAIEAYVGTQHDRHARQVLGCPFCAPV